MITIKIHDKQWFEEQCIVASIRGDLLPKYPSWHKVLTVPWSAGSGMRFLNGKVLEVEHDDGNKAGDISDARYFAGNYWIPNWAIEWIKETEND